MKNISLLGILGVIIIGGGVIWLITSRQTPPFINSLRSQSSPATTTPAAQFIPASPDTNTLQAGGSSYANPQGVYVLLYPNDYILDTSDQQHTRIYKRGATQRGQTEIYDGVIVVLEIVPLEGRSLDEVVDNRIQTSMADGTSEIVQPKRAVMLGEYPGFTYDLRSLGTATYLVVQKDGQSDDAVSITISVNDPEQVGYQQEVDGLLSTLELLK